MVVWLFDGGGLGNFDKTILELDIESVFKILMFESCSEYVVAPFY
jgi:hypothetical protein